MLEVTEKDDTMITIEHKPVTLTQLVGWGIIIIVQAFFVGGLYMRINDKVNNSASIEEVKDIARDVAANAAQIQILQDANVPYRMGQTEAAITATNARTDRLVDSFIKRVESTNAKVDNVVDQLNNLRTDVKVLAAEVKAYGAKVDSLPPGPRRMRYLRNAIKD